MATKNWEKSLAALEKVGNDDRAKKRIKAVYRRINGSSYWQFLMGRRDLAKLVAARPIRLRVQQVDGLNIVTLDGGRS